MKVIDTHCDALLKLWRDETKSFINDPEIDTNANRLKAGNVYVQFFAIWVPDRIPQELKFQVVLDQMNAFYERVLSLPNIKHIRSYSQINQLSDGEIGAVLTLEGMDAVGSDLGKLEWLYEQGVCSIGLTWNDANLCADGIGEARGAGLTQLGKKVVEMNNERAVTNDVSHLSIRAFWEVIERSTHTIASHSNAFAICQHDRNLRDEQIDELIKQNCFIGTVFFPTFVKCEQEATITDLIKHIDYIAGRGGVSHIGFGSDFDGIKHHITQLEHSGMYDQLINELCKHFSEEEVKGFCHGNFLSKSLFVIN
ncbi:dipeptidase [Shouchella patagoniensis]|uniref:dipeptidase n=1 Tax=Shouchella patagoniensis TaxID=228576 RepID=UPI000995ABB4|nr:dipeptidase [Shouchella patagoniensis]